MGIMKLRKVKKRSLLKKIIFLLIVYISFCISFYHTLKNNKTITNKKFINILLNYEDYDYMNKENIVNLVNNTIKLIYKIDFKEPKTIINNALGITSKINVKYNENEEEENIVNAASSYITNPSNDEIENPILYIYNSHQLEEYSSENLDIYGITPNVLMASYLLKEVMNKKGINTIVEDTNMQEFLSINGWNSNNSYAASRLLILSKISKYNSLKYFIDIHRDSVAKDSSTIVINDKNYAKVLFVVGKDYDTWESNYNNVKKLNSIIENKYKGLSKGILTKTGINVNGVYNQDINSNVILIEVGGKENTIMEVFNTINALSDALEEYIEEDE